MLRNIRMVINWLFRWGEHVKFAAEAGKFIADYFGLTKVLISIETGLLAAVAKPEIIPPFWIVAAWFAVTLVITNATWSLINKLQISKHMLLTPAAMPNTAVHGLIEDQPIGNSIIPGGTFTGGEELDNWSKLYEEYDTPNGKELRLKFLPDTADQESDALLLICYGYKIIKNIDAVRIIFVHTQIEYLLLNAPGTRQSPIFGIVAAINLKFGEGRDFGQKCVSKGDIERVSLSEGGRYRLTAWGETKARNLACDLIARA